MRLLRDGRLLLLALLAGAAVLVAPVTVGPPVPATAPGPTRSASHGAAPVAPPPGPAATPAPEPLPGGLDPAASGEAGAPDGSAAPDGPAGRDGPVGPDGVAGLAEPAVPGGPAAPEGSLGLDGPGGRDGPVGPDGVAGLAEPAVPGGPAAPDGSLGRDGPVGPDGAAVLGGPAVRAVPWAGTGTLTAVPGSLPAPGSGRTWRVRVEVEDGVPVDPPGFAAFVLSTLNDPRSWGRDGTATFARTDGQAEIVVVLASPETSARLCRPLVTGGRLSCRVGPRAVITHYRWVWGHPDYRGDLTGYRHYVVNHEVGHRLGHGHVGCPGPGAPAPVMQQQTLGLRGCAPNPWPYP